MSEFDALDHQVQLRALAAALERLCTLNCDMRSTTPTVFDAISVPAMSIHCYLVRLHRYTRFDFVCFHVATWYLRQLCIQDPAFCPTMHNVHRLLVAALLVSSKATDDIFHANQFMAQCGGIGFHELNKLELEMCERLHWRLLPTVEDMRELLTAISNPQASYWSAWLNAPRRLASPQAEPEASASGEATAEVGVTRLPHAKSVQDSLARLFRGGHSGSDGNLAALGSKPQVAAADGGPAATATAVRSAPEEGCKSSNGGSPRSVLQRTFSLSNLFGLSTGW